MITGGGGGGGIVGLIVIFGVASVGQLKTPINASLSSASRMVTSTTMYFPSSASVIAYVSSLCY